MMKSGSGALLKHQYVWVDQFFTRKNVAGAYIKYEPAIWFAVSAKPGRAWGLHLLLENGAVIRDIPPHAMAFCPLPESPWTIEDAQSWNVYGADFSLEEYPLFKEGDVLVYPDQHGKYLFTAIPMNDGYTEEPEQAKEFSFIKLDNGRLTIQPTNLILFIDKSFTNISGFPEDIKPQGVKWVVRESLTKG